MYLKVFPLVVILVGCATAQFRGQSCPLYDGSRRLCVPIRRCPSAISLIRRNIYPEICGFQGRWPIVCCAASENIITPNQGTDSSGTKSAKKCEEYHSKEEEEPLFGIAVVGGIKSEAKEFTHMAALGFGDQDNIQWLCGGSLISKQFVLTAAHCLYTQGIGEVKWVRLGDLNLKTETDNVKTQEFSVQRTFRHPEYDPPLQYHDIALIQLDRPAQINQYVKPSCLQTTYDLPNSNPIAVGWGRTQFAGEPSDHLMKVDLDYFSNEDCRQTYGSASRRRLPNGIIDDIQLCAGGLNDERDTCQGDSGGPLLVKSLTNSKTHFVVGVTSFGKACGIANTPGVYTRVSNYIPWIEQVVWPN